MKEKSGIIITGGIIGLFAVLLVYFGNPANMGFCVACFIRDTAGALGLHRAEVVQYIRPEIIGLVLGSFILSSMNKEFSSRGGSSPVTRFVLSIVVMIGALVFLGCP
nr:YedE-related selenium metabolism membrane protein [Bacillota bacterium]